MEKVVLKTRSNLIVLEYESCRVAVMSPICVEFDDLAKQSRKVARYMYLTFTFNTRNFKDRLYKVLMWEADTKLYVCLYTLPIDRFMYTLIIPHL